MQELLDLFQRNRGQLKKQVFLCCVISIFAKTVDVCCIFNNIDHFRPFRSFDKIFRSSRVISANARSFLLMLDHHSNFECLTLQGLLLTVCFKDIP